MARESKSDKISRTKAKTELQWNQLNRKVVSKENSIDYDTKCSIFAKS